MVLAENSLPEDSLLSEFQQRFFWYPRSGLNLLLSGHASHIVLRMPVFIFGIIIGHSFRLFMSRINLNHINLNLNLGLIFARVL